MKSRSRKKRLALPFVATTAASLSLLGLGCGSAVETPNQTVAGGCPAGHVTPFSNCSEEGLSCDSGQLDCADFDLGATCTEGVWKPNPDYSSCNPPPPPCDGPLTPGGPCYDPGVTCDVGVDACGLARYVTCSPDYTFELNQAPPCDCPQVLQGDSCEVVGASCSAGQDECGQILWATCLGDHAYVVSARGSCNPPPPDDCFNWTDETACNNAGYCRWLVPGCADEPAPNLTAPGCYAGWSCYGDEYCLDGRTCQETGYDPCYGDICEACYTSDTLCLP